MRSSTAAASHADTTPFPQSPLHHPPTYLFLPHTLPANTSCTKLPIPHLWSKPNHQQLTPQLLLLLPLKQPQQKQPNNPVRLLLALCFWLLPITHCYWKELGQKKGNTNTEAKISHAHTDTHTHSLSLSLSQRHRQTDDPQIATNRWCTARARQIAKEKKKDSSWNWKLPTASAATSDNFITTAAWCCFFFSRTSTTARRRRSDVERERERWVAREEADK